MVLMEKQNDRRYVCNAFVDAFKANGYSVVGEAVEEAPAETPEDTSDKASEKFACPVCGKEYSKKGSLDKHIAEAHKED